MIINNGNITKILFIIAIISHLTINILLYGKEYYFISICFNMLWIAIVYKLTES